MRKLGEAFGSYVVLAQVPLCDRVTKAPLLWDEPQFSLSNGVPLCHRAPASVLALSLSAELLRKHLTEALTTALLPCTAFSTLSAMGVGSFPTAEDVFLQEDNLGYIHPLL